MFIQGEGIDQELSQLRHVTTEEVAGTIGTDDAARALWQRESVLYVDDLADVVKDFEAMNELATCLREVETRNDVGRELVLYSKVTLEVLIEELEELILQSLSGSTLSK